MLTEFECSKAITGRSPNYFSFAVRPTLEDNLLMIANEDSIKFKNIDQTETVEIIFEVSLN